LHLFITNTIYLVVMVPDIQSQFFETNKEVEKL
jgi:hypothetical protein